jgi:hypothetical protein
MKKDVQILEKAKIYLSENKASLLEQAIILINHALTYIQPEPSLSFSPSPSPSPSLEEKFITFIISLNERLSRMETILASKSLIGSQALQSGLINIPISYVTAASYRELTISSDNRTNAIIQHSIGN